MNFIILTADGDPVGTGPHGPPTFPTRAAAEAFAAAHVRHPRRLPEPWRIVTVAEAYGKPSAAPGDEAALLRSVS